LIILELQNHTGFDAEVKVYIENPEEVGLPLGENILFNTSVL
jgi:hypothetical protein